MLRFLTAGESHGPCLTMIIEGLPAGLTVEKSIIDADLRRRQGGYGRGGRMKIEKDAVRILSGVRHGKALGLLSIGGVGYDVARPLTRDAYPAEMWDTVEASPVRCADGALTEKMIARILEAKRAGDTCGGTFEVVAFGVPIGLGSFAQWDRRLSARLGMAMMSIPSVKAMEIGAGFTASRTPGSEVPVVLRHAVVGPGYHLTDDAGGMELGITNGEPVVVRVGVKPIPTLAHPLPSVDLATGENIDQSRYERSDVCVVPAAGVVGEAMVAIVLTEAILEKFGGDSMEEIMKHYHAP